jgi:hypothetical protein
MRMDRDSCVINMIPIAMRLESDALLQKLIRAVHGASPILVVSEIWNRINSNTNWDSTANLGSATQALAARSSPFRT